MRSKRNRKEEPLLLEPQEPQVDPFFVTFEVSFEKLSHARVLAVKDSLARAYAEAYERINLPYEISLSLEILPLTEFRGSQVNVNFGYSDETFFEEFASRQEMFMKKANDIFQRIPELKIFYSPQLSSDQEDSNLIRTKSGRTGKLITTAEDDRERVGLIKYDDEDTMALRNQKSYRFARNPF